MASLDDAPLPTPYDGWELAAYAFDQDRDPNRFVPAIVTVGHGRLLVELDVTGDADGRVEGLVQFVHGDFATDIADARLAALIIEVTATAPEVVDERSYLEVEHYEDGTTLVARLFDAAGLDELERRGAADPEDDITWEDCLAELPDDDAPSP